MNYFIKRDLNEYGPYSLSDLQRYVASGNIQMTDMARSEGMTDWVPVAQVVGNIAVPAPMAPAANVVPAVMYPDPPNLHWAIVLVLAIVTCGIFGWVWVFIEAMWVKKIQPESKAVLYYALAVGLFVAAGVMGVNRDLQAVSGITQLAATVLWLVASFNMKASIEEHYNYAEPIGLQLSGVMTFFFNYLYFQYHFTRINEMKRQRAMGVQPGA